MAENGEYAVDPDTGLKVLKSKKDPKALDKVQALADKLFADGGEEKMVQMSEVKKGSEILNELKRYTFQTLLELGTLDRVEKAAYVKFSEVAKELRNNVVVPEEKWLQIEKDLQTLNDISYSAVIENQKLHGKLERIKTLMENAPRCCLDGGHYCERDAWLEELKKEMEGISNFETVRR